jgi:trimeric autotransporter adhesin
MKRILLVLGFAICWLASSFATSPRETHELVCSAPQQISAVASQDGTNAKVSFSNTGAAAYVVQYRLGYDSVWTSLDNIVITDINAIYLKDLKSCAWYVVRVKSVCSPNESSEWRGTEFKTGGCTVACPMPAGLFASARDSIASLNWLATNSSAGYSVMWKAKRSSVWKTENVTTNSLILKGLLPCTEYQFKVKAMCGLTGSSEYTESKSFKTLGCVAPCVTPREVKGEGGEGKIGIVWASTGARAYEIQYKIADDNGAWTTVRSTTNSFVINGLRPCAKYFIQVRSLCSGDNSTTILFSEWSSQIVVATTGCVTPARCEPVRRLGFQPTANGAVLVWETVVGAKFEIQFKAKRDSIWKTVTSARSSYELTGLASCTEYQYRVRVYCANGGTSAWSNVMTFKTSGCQAPCKAPKLVKTYAVDSVAVVTWAGEGATKFILEYKVADAATWTTLNVTGNVHVLTGLKRCVTYNVRIKSVCSTTAMSDYTEIAKFTTGGCQPSTTCIAPRQLSGGSDATTAKFAWSSTTDRGYIFEYKEVVDNSDRWISDSVRANYTVVFNLKPCTKYVARVRSICVEGISKVSAPSELYYFVTTCVPTNCVAPLTGGTQLAQDSTVYFAWANTGARKYEVEIVGIPDGYLNIVKVDSNYLKLTLPACKIYQWKVRAVCADGSVSAWSEVRKFETFGCRPNPNVCAAPINLKNELAGVDSNQVAYFIWASTIVTVAPEKYEIQYRSVSSSGTTPWMVDSLVGTAYKAPVRRCQVYEWKVRKNCGNGLYSAWVSSKFETKCVVTSTCATPTTGTSFIYRDTTVYIYWGGSNAPKYEIEVSNANGYTKNIKVDSSAILLPLPACQIYAWKVRSICADGSVSAWSETRKFETKCNVINPCPPPPVPRITVTADGIATLLWDVRDSFFLIYRTTTDTAIMSMQITTSPNGVLLKNLRPCTEYILRIARACPNNVYEWSTVNFKVPGVGCFTNGGNGTDVQGLAVRNVVKGLGISPNPGSEYVQVNYELAEPTDVNISLMNLQGQVVSQYNGGKQDAGTYMQTLDNLSELNTGLYMLVIRANGKVSVSQKWMKQ